MVHPLKRSYVGLAMALLLAGPASLVTAAASASPKPAWWQSLQHYTPDPTFSPLHASQAELLAHGFPERPDGSPSELAAWTRAMKAAKVYLAPYQQAPPPGLPRHTQWSTNWAGHYMVDSCCGGHPWTFDAALWTQPAVGSSSTTETVSFWVGIGNSNIYANGPIIQTGCDLISASIPRYNCWWEDFPGGPVLTPIVPRAGDVMYATVTYMGDHTTLFYMEDQTQGTYSNTRPSTTSINQTAAEFIGEQLSGTLPYFSTTSFSSCVAGQSGSDKPLQSTNNTLVIMTNTGTSSGRVLLQPGAVNNNTSSFSMTWKSGS